MVNTFLCLLLSALCLHNFQEKKSSALARLKQKLVKSAKQKMDSAASESQEENESESVAKAKTKPNPLSPRVHIKDMNTRGEETSHNNKENAGDIKENAMDIAEHEKSEEKDNIDTKEIAISKQSLRKSQSSKSSKNSKAESKQQKARTKERTKKESKKEVEEECVVLASVENSPVVVVKKQRKSKVNKPQPTEEVCVLDVPSKIF